MQDVPKIVKDRLRAAVPVASHPDADVLTAFSEQLLPDRERAIVLEHLALCGDCREIVLLAAPTVEATQAVYRPAPSRGISWPVLRWGLVALGVFAIASLGLMQYRRQAAHSMPIAEFAPQVAKEAKNEAPPSPAVPAAVSDQEKAKVLPIPAPAGRADADKTQGIAIASKESDRLEQLAKLQSPGTSAPKAGAIHGATMGGPTQFPHGPKASYQNAFNYQANTNSVQSNNQSQAAPPPFAKQAPNGFVSAGANAPAAAQTVQADGQFDVQARNTQDLQLESKSMPLQPAEGGEGHSVERAKDLAVVVGGNSKVPAASPQPPAAFTGVLSPPNASWTITAGSLQRSLDRGKTWQDVSVSGAPAAGASYALALQNARTSAEKADKKVPDLHGARDAVPTVFRAVTANGADVWAGGSGGMLYHSTDSGTSWTRVVPTSGGASLTGDIVHVDFSDPQHGRITTSAPEVWLTSDGGLTWLKQ